MIRVQSLDSSRRAKSLRRRVRYWANEFRRLEHLDTSHGGIAARVRPILDDVDSFLKQVAKDYFPFPDPEKKSRLKKGSR